MTDDVATLIERLRDRISELEAERDAAHGLARTYLAWSHKAEAERDSWKEEHGKLLDDVGEYMAKENTERAALGDAIRAKTIEECAQIVQEDFDRPDMAQAIRALAQTDEGKT